jgi:hypothetical protein
MKMSVFLSFSLATCNIIKYKIATFWKDEHRSNINYLYCIGLKKKIVPIYLKPENKGLKHAATFSQPVVLFEP